MYMIELDPLYKSYQLKNSSRVNWGHRGQNGQKGKKKKTLLLLQITAYDYKINVYALARPPTQKF